MRSPRQTGSPPPDALGSDPRELELSSAEMRSLVDLAMERIVRHVETLPEQPMHATSGARKKSRALREPMPERGASVPRLLRTLFGRVLPASLNTASPGYLAYIPGGGLFHSAVADLIAGATNRYVGVWQAAPLLVRLETNVLEWFRDLVGLPSSGGGVLTSGGSIANLMAVVAARADRLPPDFLAGTIYTSEEVHHSVRKAALVAGFAPERVRAVPTDEAFRMDLDALDRMMGDDRRAGALPFLVVASAGTTNTGAVDDLEGAAAIAARRGAWLHVDAAYGGFFLLTESGRRALRGIERADSVTLDPHKGLFLPYGTGCLLVRDLDTLRRAHHVPAAYLPKMQTEPDLVDFCELSPELSRDARGLRVWLPLKMHGAGAFRAALEEKLTLAREAADALRRTPGIEIVAEPQLSLFAFRAHPEGMPEGEALDALNRRLIAEINRRQRVLLTGTMLRCGFVLRICVLSFRTHRDRMEACVEDVRDGLEVCLQSTPA